MKATALVSPLTFQVIDIPEPGPPADDEALVQVRVMGVCGTDISGYLGRMPFIQLPRILGHELGVEVLAVGKAVSALKPGDSCCVEPYLNCGVCGPCLLGKTNCCESLSVLGVHCDGGFCERLLLPANKLHVANDLPYSSLALVEMLGIGCHAVNRAAVRAGEEVLILGAGPIGLSVLEFALLAGAKVRVYELGAARRAFVHQHYPLAEVLEAAPEECCAEVVFDATGNAASMAQSLRFAKFAGRIVYVGITKDSVALDDALFHRRELTLLASRNAVSADFTRILALLRSGELDVSSWISHGASFDEAPAAFAEWTAPGTEVVKAVVQVG